VAKVKVVNTNLDQNLNGTNFTHTTSETIFQFGSFALTSNFSGRVPIDYTNTLSTFVRPVTLETLGVNDVRSAIMYDQNTNAVLNLDKSNLNTFIRFGSAYEFLRVSVQEIILAYPGSLFANSKVNPNGNITFTGFSYNPVTNISTFYVPIAYIINKFGLVYNSGNTSMPDNMAIKNLNISYDQYAIWSKYLPDLTFPIVSFSGYNTNNPTQLNYNTTIIQVLGDPFSFISGTTNPITHIKTINIGYFDFHIRPNNVVFDEFRALISPYEQYMMSQRDGINGFIFTINNPTLLDDGNITYSNTQVLWNTSDGYNIDIDTNAYQRFLQILLTIGTKYDQIKTDLIARFLTPASIKTYDLTQDGKMTKLLRIYGREFDQLREFIDSLVYINTVTYNKLNNIPDQLIQNLARTFGWNYFNLVNETELVNNVLGIDTVERNLNTDLLPAEINIELWRRILINTNYFWKSKGTRQAIKAMFLMIGIPEPFINITEYIYLVDGKINPNTVPLTRADFPSNSLPYDTSGYPVAPTETNDFYFQVSGDTDAGQTYMNAFRMAGFDLQLTVDNRKSWIQTGATVRVDDSTPQYYQQDSKLVLNTKEVDVALDTARGIEYDVYEYIQKDFKANNSGFTMPFSYVNISLGLTGLTQSIFKLPAPYNKQQGNLEVRYNGILLNAPRIYTGGTGTSATLIEADYSVDPINNTFTLLTASAYSNTYRTDVIQATFIYSGTTSKTGLTITVEYVVTRIKPSLMVGTTIPLPSYPRGDVQVTINGIALTKGTPQFTADYIVNPANSSGGSNSIIIQNPELIGYLNISPYVQVAYVKVTGSNDINARSEVVRVDSFNSSKIYYNVGANKYVYKLNYKVNNASDVKFLVDGIALVPNKDYSINVLDPFEIFLPSGIRYGTVISAYYLVGGNAYFTPVISDEFGLGDISKLSFLEFIDLIQRKMINARNRKTVSDFKGGWYPALLRIYELYLQRGLLPPNNPLHSNGYTFANLYPFLSKYNAFFQKFVDELLSATIILRGGGLLIRNTVFTKQKFMYKRGVNLFSGGTIGIIDMRGNAMLQYRGDDGSQFLIDQEISQPQPPIPPTFYVDTISGTTGIGSIINTGGMNIQNYNLLTSYGIQYRCAETDPWSCCTLLGAPIINNYNTSISGLLENTKYAYQAFVIANVGFALGQIYSGITLSTPVTPGLLTKLGTPGVTIIDSGGIAITGGSCADWYGMQYRVVGPVNTDIVVTPDTLSMPAVCTTCNVCVTGDISNTYFVACNVPWILVNPSSSGAPSPSGAISQITTCNNVGHIPRTGLICYAPTLGTTKCVTVCQAPTIVPFKSVNFLCCTGGISEPLQCLSLGTIGVSPTMSAGECFTAFFTWSLFKPSTPFAPQQICVELCCNGTTIGMCQFSSKNCYSNSGNFGTRTVRPGDVFDATAYATAQTTDCTPSSASIAITNITSVSGCFCLGAQTSVYAHTSSCVPLPPELIV
jgi:hypothetical protein